MATYESRRVSLHRKEKFERATILLEKGSLKLVKILALHEGVTRAEIYRRALYARGGLRAIPNHDMMESIGEPQTQAEACAALLKLQAADEQQTEKRYETVLTAADLAGLRETLRKIQDTIEIKQAADTDAPPFKVPLSGREIGILRRVLADVTPVDK